MKHGLAMMGTKGVMAAFAAMLVVGGASWAAQPEAPSIDLTDTQVKAIKIGAAKLYSFPVEKDAVGTIDFNEDATVPVFPSYQGKIISVFAQLGDNVRKGKPLYTIDSPDLIAAESTLIGAAAQLDLTRAALDRAKILCDKQGMAQKDYEQAVSDERTAEGTLHSAREALRVFGKADREIDRIISNRKIDPVLVVGSPISGRVTARNAQPGLLVQPGNLPAPYVVAATGLKWMLASVPESEAASYHVGETVKATVSAFPGKVFEGKVDRLGSSVDPNTHRLTIRSEISDPNDDLRPNMFADFVIETGAPVIAIGLPLAAVVREGDGSMVVWATADGRRFTQRIITIGMTRNGIHQILAGVQPGEKVAVDGAVFLSNMVSSGVAD